MNIMIPQLSIQERDRRYQIVRAEMAKWAKVVKEARIKID